MDETTQVWVCKKHGPKQVGDGCKRYLAYRYKGRDIWGFKCGECGTEKAKARYAADPAKSLETVRAWRKANPDKLAVIQARYQSVHSQAISQRQKENREDLRLRILRHYSKSEVPACACCGTAKLAVLCLDHIHGDGAQRRKETGRKSESYWRLVEQEGFPDRYRVLCQNCNMTRAIYGRCPHEAEFVVNDPKNPSQKYQRKLRSVVLTRYGGKCASCDEAQKEFLAMDHVNGGGRAHRKEIKARDAVSFNRWLVYEGFPPDFQILCHNCNFEKGASKP